MALKQTVAPTIEPVTLTEAKTHLRLDSGSFADFVASSQTIAPGSHVVAAAYSLVGNSIEVLGYSAVVELVSGTNGAGGTVDVKLQDSDDNATWTDVSGGAFTQITEANDNATYEKAYTGGRRYLRVVCTVAVAACEFGVDIIKGGSAITEDNLVSDLITTAREMCEAFQHRAFNTQTWELWLDAFPNDEDHIDIPLPPLISISSIKYYDTNNVEATFSSADYFVDTKSEPGRVVLGYDKEWPSTTLRPANGVCVTFVAGYGATAASVPKKVKQAMLLTIGHLFEHREDVGQQLQELPLGAQHLLWYDRIVEF